MKAEMKIGITLLILFFYTVGNLYSQVLTGSKTNVTYKENYGIKCVEIKTQLKNNTDKTVAKVNISVFFKDKTYSSFDVTAPNELKNAEASVNIPPRSEKEVTFIVSEPKNINMIYNSTSLQRAIYTDGSVADF